MRLEPRIDHLRIYPEGEVEQVYLEKTLGLTEKPDPLSSLEVSRINTPFLSYADEKEGRSIVRRFYVEIKRGALPPIYFHAKPVQEQKTSTVQKGRCFFCGLPPEGLGEVQTS